jgi:antitoxin component HigA of HigAB toxin-antitoxin module
MLIGERTHDRVHGVPAGRACICLLLPRQTGLSLLGHVVGDDEDHELAGLLDVVGQFVEEYENAHHTIPDAAPHDVPRFLLDQHGLKQNDLSAEIGGQSGVSVILSGRRTVNARQAKAENWMYLN